jgi:hypothetical protein
MSRWTVSAYAIGIFALSQIAPAAAAVVTLDATERGFITQNGATNPTNSNIPVAQRDYLLGNCTFPTSCFDTGGGEYRDFFSFQIPVLAGPIASAAFQIDTVGVTLAQSPTLTASFTSLTTTTSFAALGTGVVYGSAAYGVSDANAMKTIALNQSAITALLGDEGGTFLIGGRVTSSSNLDPAAPDQLIYVHSGPGDLTRLVIVTTDIAEPGGLAVVGVGILGIFGLRLWLGPPLRSR